MEKRVLNYNEKEVAAAMAFLNATAQFINESFVHLCTESGIEPTTELFRASVYDGPLKVQEVLQKAAEFDFLKLGINSPFMKEKMLKDTAPIVDKFSTLIDQITARFDRETHFFYNRFHSVINLREAFEIKKGLAIVSEKTVEEIKKHFTAAIETKSQQEAYDLLSSIAKSLSALDVLIQNKNLIPVELDRNYLTTDEAGKVIVDVNCIQYF